MKSLEFCSGGNQTLSEEVAEQAEELNILILGETGTFFLPRICAFSLVFTSLSFGSFVVVIETYRKGQNLSA